MYDHIAKSYNTLHGEEQLRKLRILLARSNLTTQDSVLDVGCATAHLAKYLPDSYVGVDPSKPLVEQASNHLDVRVGDGKQLEFGSDSFDAVLSLTALHNYANPLQGVDELIRVSKRLLLVGVLKKSENHDQIVSYLKKNLQLVAQVDDMHDTLLVLSKRRT